MANHNKIVTLLVLEAVFVIQDTLNKGRSLSAEIVMCQIAVGRYPHADLSHKFDGSQKKRITEYSNNSWLGSLVLSSTTLPKSDRT